MMHGVTQPRYTADIARLLDGERDGGRIAADHIARGAARRGLDERRAGNPVSDAVGRGVNLSQIVITRAPANASRHAPGLGRSNEEALRGNCSRRIRSLQCEASSICFAWTSPQ